MGVSAVTANGQHFQNLQTVCTKNAGPRAHLMDLRILAMRQSSQLFCFLFFGNQSSAPLRFENSRFLNWLVKSDGQIASFRQSIGEKDFVDFILRCS